jgi:hypothetical protein
MRALNRRALLVGLAAAALSGAGGDVGCSITKPTEIVPGAYTQVRVPKDLAGIQIEVTANGAPKFCTGYQVDNGLVLLPSTLGIIQGQPNTTLRITMRGYDSATSNDLFGCTHAKVNDTTLQPEMGPPPRVLRQAVVTYVDQRTLFLPMQLTFGCFDVDCSSPGGAMDQTCKAGQCVDPAVPASSLADFDPSLVDGKQDCFSPSTCFPPYPATISAVPVDATGCVYSAPQATPGAPAQGLNVRIAYAQNTWGMDPATGAFALQGGLPIEQEILNVDAQEGFTVDAKNPARFTLAPGLCKLVHNTATPPTTPSGDGGAPFKSITDVQVALGCASKPVLLPFCAAEQNGNVSNNPPAIACGVGAKLTPAPSAVYVVVDNSATMGPAFGPTGYATVMNLSFADPVFKRTYVAFQFLTHAASECTSAMTQFTSPMVDFGLPSTVQPVIAPLLLTPPSASDTTDMPAPLYLLAAMRSDAGAYKHLSDFVNNLGGGVSDAAVMFFVNRVPVAPSMGDAGGGDAASDAGTDGGSAVVVQRTTGAECSPTGPTVQADIESAVSQAVSSGLSTYFVVLDNNDHQPPLAFFQQVAQDVGTSTGGGATVSVLDATSARPDVVLTNFQQTVTSAVTCAYDLPTGIDSTAQLAFNLPANTSVNQTSVPVPVAIKFDSSCTTANRNSGTSNGWGIDHGHIVICGASCTTLQSTIAVVTASALLGASDGGLPSLDGAAPAIPDVPVTATIPCPKK